MRERPVLFAGRRRAGREPESPTRIVNGLEDELHVVEHGRTLTPSAAAPTPAQCTPTAEAVRAGNGPGGELASTGTDPTVPLGIAGALLAAGTALTVVARHRRRASRA
ncbi:LPXTG cell wall anchor domain-containing protein [Curtobacterium sp. NPDC090217]|uniref:LPXTG cell wall anchor domain-containing protein n=1 Tax=Curtobacterium sp. NPDC090217 TaxID=3363970 RepID=UPI003807849B